MARPDFLLLVSSDSKLLQEYIDSSLAGNPPKDAKWERHIFWGDAEPDSNFWNCLCQKSLFVLYRAVIVRNSQEWSNKVWQSLSESILASSADVWPILCIEVEFEKGKFKIPAAIQKLGCVEKAQKKGWFIQIPPLAGSGLRSYIVNYSKKLNLKFDSQALNKFCEKAIPDANALSNELVKLSLISPDGVVRPEYFDAVSINPESNIFNIIKKLENGDLAGTWNEVFRLSLNNPVFYLIALLAREFKLLWQIAAGENPWLNPKDADSKRILADKLKYSGISKGFCYLAETEWQIKSGRYTPEQAMEYLVINLISLFARK